MKEPRFPLKYTNLPPKKPNVYDVCNFCSYLEKRERERNVLFNDALNTFYLRLYGVRHMVKDHSDSEKGNPLPPHRLLLSISKRDLLYAPSHRQDNTYHGLCYTSRGALVGTRNIPQKSSKIQKYKLPEVCMWYNIKVILNKCNFQLQSIYRELKSRNSVTAFL